MALYIRYLQEFENLGKHSIMIFKDCDRCKKKLCEKDGGRMFCIDCQKALAKHEQCLTKQGFLVDVKLVHLIEHLNDLGFVTRNSCQDNIEDKTWIQFESIKSFKNLIRCAKQHGVEFLSDINMDESNFKLDIDDDDFEHGWDVDFMVSWRFPKEDIERLTDIINTWKQEPAYT